MHGRTPKWVSVRTRCCSGGLIGAMEPIHHMGAFNAAVSSCRDHLRSFMSWPFLCECSGCCDKDSTDDTCGGGSFYSS